MSLNSAGETKYENTKNFYLDFRAKETSVKHVCAPIRSVTLFLSSIKLRWMDGVDSTVQACSNISDGKLPPRDLSKRAGRTNKGKE